VDKEASSGFLPAKSFTKVLSTKKKRNKRTDNFERLPVQHDA